MQAVEELYIIFHTAFCVIQKRLQLHEREKVQGFDMNTHMHPDILWERITARQGDTFYTKKGLPFTYYIKGGELFASRRERSITRSTFEKAWQRIRENPQEMSGPKKLNVYGAPYVWAILSTILESKMEEESQ